MRLTCGEFRLVYDPSPDFGAPWYVNDHCVIRDEDGRWHLFGINHAEPANPDDEKTFLHATAPEIWGPWRTEPTALTVAPDYHGERHLWAPHVVRADGRYWMFYAAGGDDPTAAAINLATSTDLASWTRAPDGPLFRDGLAARDPMVCWTGSEWTMYYTATEDPRGGRHVVAYRCSDDLRRWGPRRIAFTSQRGTRDGASCTESPFVTNVDGRWYLFIGPCGGYARTPDGYVCTAVYASDTPWEFSADDLVTRLPAHAAEVVHDRWITSAGWGQGGVFVAELHWSPR